MEKTATKKEINRYRVVEQQLTALSAQVYKEFLEQLDQWLLENRDKHIFKILSTNKVNLKTVFGNITITRRRYRVELPFSDPYEIYLLDEVMGFERTGAFFKTVAEKIVALREQSELSFKQIAEELKETLLLDVTRQGVFNVYLACKQEKASQDTELIEQTG